MNLQFTSFIVSSKFHSASCINIAYLFHMHMYVNRCNKIAQSKNLFYVKIVKIFIEIIIKNTYETKEANVL